MTQDFEALCKSLLHCVDTGNTDAEESVLCQMRVALRDAEQAQITSDTSSEEEV